MKTTLKSRQSVYRHLLALSLGSSFGGIALAQTKEAPNPTEEALSSIIERLPTTAAGDFVIHFDGLPAGQKVFDVALDQGLSGTASGTIPLSILGTSRVHIRGARRGLEGDSNRAMIYDGECGGNAETCSGQDDGGHLYHPAEGNLLIVSQNNDGSNPDDNYRGGQLYFDFGGFGSGSVTITSLELVNSVGEGAVIELYAEGERLREIAVPQSDDERVLSLIEVDTAGVDLMRVTARGQFALNDVSFTLP